MPGRAKQTKQNGPPAEVSATHLPDRLHCNPAFMEIQVQPLGKTMTIRYKIRTPRMAMGFAALGMTALTIGALVVLPAWTEADSPPCAMVAVQSQSPDGVSARGVEQ
jgi:hypothetical protein